MNRPPAQSVPCGSCSRCCVGELVVLHPEHGDDVSSYRTVRVVDPTTGRPAFALDQKPNAECTYLEAGRCSIHERRPRMCQVFDCRRWFRDHSRADRRRIERQTPGAKAIFARGRELLGAK